MARDGMTAAIWEAIQCALLPGGLIAGSVNPGGWHHHTADPG